MMECPNCGYCIKTRASIGQGTRKGKGLALNQNRRNILGVFHILDRSLSVRDVQQYLHEKGIKRESRRNTGWNYHTVQLDLSLLVGGGFLFMTKVDEQFTIEGHNTDKIPYYKLNKDIEMRVSDAIDI